MYKLEVHNIELFCHYSNGHYHNAFCCGNDIYVSEILFLKLKTMIESNYIKVHKIYIGMGFNIPFKIVLLHATVITAT